MAETSESHSKSGSPGLPKNLATIIIVCTLAIIAVVGGAVFILTSQNSQKAASLADFQPVTSFSSSGADQIDSINEDQTINKTFNLGGLTWLAQPLDYQPSQDLISFNPQYYSEYSYVSYEQLASFADGSKLIYARAYEDPGYETVIPFKITSQGEVLLLHQYLPQYFHRRTIVIAPQVESSYETILGLNPPPVYTPKFADIGDYYLMELAPHYNLHGFRAYADASEGVEIKLLETDEQTGLRLYQLTTRNYLKSGFMGHALVLATLDGNLYTYQPAVLQSSFAAVGTEYLGFYNGWDDEVFSNWEYFGGLLEPCGSRSYFTVLEGVTMRDLWPAGTLWNNDDQPFYSFRETSSYLDVLYDEYAEMYYGTDKGVMTFADYASGHHHIIIQDPLGNYVLFVSTEVMPMMGCG